MRAIRLNNPIFTTPTRLAVALLLAGCATTASHPSGSAVDRLSHLAKSAEASDPAADDAPAPPGVGAEALSLAPDDDPLARLSIREATDRFRTEVQPAADAEPASPPTAEALLLYISGRSRWLGGDLTGALKDLQASSKADPSAPEPWREMGEAQRQLGDRLSAAAAFREALRRDPDDVESLLRVGLWSLQRRDAASAIDLLARARDAASNSADPASPFIIDFNLGRAMLDAGALKAGVQLTRQGLALPVQLDSPTVFLSEVGALNRRRGDAWRDIGDADMRLGEFSSALNAYEKARHLPSLDSAGLLLRFVYATMKASRPAQAAQAILDALAVGSDLSGDRLLPLIQYVGRWSDLGPLLRRAIDQRRADLSEKDAARLGSLYARAAAAALSDGAAVRSLRSWLATHPSDIDAVRELFHRIGDDPARAVDETILLIQRSPLNESHYTQALIHMAPSIDAALDVARTRRSAQALLLGARLLEQMGRLPDAVDLLKPIVDRGLGSPSTTTVLIELLAKLGRTDQAQNYLDRLEDDGSPEDRMLRARALASLSRYSDALDTLLPALEPTDDAPAPLAGDPNELEASLLAANLAWRAGDADAVARWSRHAIELNPSFEQAYARLIDLYNRAGPLADPNKLAEVVRQLRAAAPSSRTLRWLRAQELAATGQYEQAERDLISLALETPSQPVIDLLTTIWLQTGSVAQAEGWLRAQMEQHPADAAPMRALARLLAQDDRAQLGAALLKDWLAKRPYDADTARQMESILRDKLDRTDEADQHALARLERQPATFARAVELTPILIRKKQVRRAVDELLATAQAVGATPPAMSRQFIRDVYLLTQQAIGEAVAIEPVIQLGEIALDRFGQLPVEVLDSHLHLLAKAHAPYDQTMRVLERGMTQHRDRAAELASLTVQRLSIFDQNPLALKIAEKANELLDSPSEALLARWVQIASSEKDRAAAEKALRAIAAARKATAILTMLRTPRPPEGDRANAELTMLAAVAFEQNGAAFDDVAALYELALQFDPHDGTVNNNFGYLLADRGERLDEAERLIQRALSISPNDPFATDSLGWVRYKKGMIADERGPDGKIVQNGAVSLLQRAIRLGVNRSSPEVHDHLGDALWAMGDADRAIGRWQAAKALLEEAIANKIARPDSSKALERIGAKITEAKSGGRPKIAEIIGAVNVGQ